MLRVLQEKEFEPVGSNEVLRSDVRLIAATSIDLEAAVRKGTFRADLYYRLNVLTLFVPPLRERLEDLPALCEAIFDALQGRHELHPEAMALLARHAWPGNVRELHNVLERACLLSDDTLLDRATVAAAIGTLQALPETQRAAASDGQIEDFHQARASFERELIRKALAITAGDVPQAAQRLGLGLSLIHI